MCWLVSKERDAAEFSWLSLRLSSPALGEAAGKLEVPRPWVVGTYRVLAAVGGQLPMDKTLILSRDEAGTMGWRRRIFARIEYIMSEIQFY